GEPPNEAALLERRDQPMHARLRFEIQRLAHFVEARADPVLLQASIDEEQQFALLGGEHWPSLPRVGTNGELLGNKMPAVKRCRAISSRCSATGNGRPGSRSRFA